jgi:hypothetical protein
MNVLGGEELLAPPWNLKPGDTLTLTQPRTQSTQTVTLAGFYATTPSSTSSSEP